MKEIRPTILTIAVAAIASVLFTNFLLFAGEQKAGTITIVATVHPQRIVIVDENLTITKILSNTAQDIRPLVLMGGAEGKELPFTEAISAQYQALKSSLDFSQPGVIYERDARPIQALFKRIDRTLRTWWGRII